MSYGVWILRENMLCFVGKNYCWFQSMALAVIKEYLLSIAPDKMHFWIKSIDFFLIVAYFSTKTTVVGTLKVPCQALLMSTETYYVSWRNKKNVCPIFPLIWSYPLRLSALPLSWLLNLYHCLGIFSSWQIDIFLFFPENRLWHFMQIVSSTGDNLHEMSKPYFLGRIRKIFQNVVCWNFYPVLC